jgi:glucan phosphoethanolaminetransferase (alkaline phosphatase superfamily)
MHPKFSWKGHALAIGAMLLAIIITSAAWIGNVLSGPPLDGWTGGVTIIFVPLLLIIFGFAWLFIRLIVRRFLALSTRNVAWVSALASYLVVLITCGPVACFANTNSNRRMGFFLVGGAILIALTHHLVLTRFPKQTPPTQSEPEHV